MNTLLGNDQIKVRLQRLIEQDRVPHLLLFSGPDGIGKKLFAKAFCSEWLSKISKRTISQDHVDICTFTVEGKTGMHSIASMRRLINGISLSPYAAEGKAIIIDDADRMLATSSNILLKTLEEPPKHTYILLVTSEKDRLLPTIVSRCQEMRFSRCSYDEVCTFLSKHHKASPEDIEHVAERANGSIGRALHLLEKNVDDMQTMLFAFLSSGDYLVYHRIQDFAQNVQKLLDEKKSQHEQLLKKAMKEDFEHILNEQEIEGALSLSWRLDVDMLFHTILAFFRDLEALSCSAEPASLFFAHKKETLIQCYNQGELLSLEKLLPLLEKAKLAVDRSTPLQHVLEGLFLQCSD